MKIRGTYLRFSLDDDIILKADNSLRVPIDPYTGRLHKYGYTSTWNKLEKHPNSNLLFENTMLPVFDKCVETVKKLHAKIPFIKYIGWDVIVNKDEEIIIIEWNAIGNDIDFQETVIGPTFADIKWEKLALPNLVTPYQKGSY